MYGYLISNIDELTLTERPNPKAGPTDAIVHPFVVSFSPADIYSLFNYDIIYTGQYIIGHQAVGEVVEIGDQVADFQVGDRVIIPAITPDWSNPLIHRRIPAHTPDLFNGWKFGRTKDGVFADLVHVNDADANLAHLPDSLPPEQAVLLCSTASIGMNGAEIANIKLGSRVAVIGTTPAGLIAIRGALLQGAGQICSIGQPNVYTSLTYQYGATDHIPFTYQFPFQECMDITENEGFDSVIIADTSSDMLENAFRISAPGATIANSTLLTGDAEATIPITQTDYGIGDRIFRGSCCPGGRYRMEQLINLATYGRFELAPLITHTFHGMSNIPQAIELCRKNCSSGCKPVVFID